MLAFITDPGFLGLCLAAGSLVDQVGFELGTYQRLTLNSCPTSQVLGVKVRVRTLPSLFFFYRHITDRVSYNERMFILDHGSSLRWKRLCWQGLGAAEYHVVRDRECGEAWSNWLYSGSIPFSIIYFYFMHTRVLPASMSV